MPDSYKDVDLRLRQKALALMDDSHVPEAMSTTPRGSRRYSLIPAEGKWRNADMFTGLRARGTVRGCARAEQLSSGL